MASEVIFAPESLGTELTQEVLASCVDHQVTAHILAGVEASVTMVALVFLLPNYSGGLFFRMGSDVLQQDLGAPQLHSANPTGEVSATG